MTKLPRHMPMEIQVLAWSSHKLEAQWAEPVSITFHSALRKLNTEPSIGASHKISLHFGKAVSEKKIFRNRPIRNKNCLWRPYLLMDRDEMSILYRGPPIDASYQVSVHLAKPFLQKATNQKQELSLAAMFVNKSGRNQQS